MLAKGGMREMGCFDEVSADEYENAACDMCGAEVRLNDDKTWWECTECDFKIAAIPINGKLEGK